MGKAMGNEPWNFVILSGGLGYTRMSDTAATTRTRRY